jgi:hypothetical protein
MNPIAAVTYKAVPPPVPLVDWTALWHIVVISLAFGCGLALGFGLLLLGLSRGGDGKRGVEKIGGYLLAGLCGAACIVAIGVGVYVMCNPPKSKPDKVVAVTSSYVAGIRTDVAI